MGTVFIPQEPKRKDDGTGAMVPLYDLTPALKFGTLKVLLPHGPVMLSTKPMVDHMRTEMDEFCDEDYILAVGDPAAIISAGMVASQANKGRVKLLWYDRQQRAYIPLQFDLFNTVK